MAMAVAVAVASASASASAIAIGDTAPRISCGLPGMLRNAYPDAQRAVQPPNCSAQLHTLTLLRRPAYVSSGQMHFFADPTKMDWVV